MNLKFKVTLLNIALILSGVVFSQTNGNTLSLNGNWKFNTFLGEGSNYLEISPGAEDIVIDNAQTNLVVVNGTWKHEIEPERDSKCWGTGYLGRHFSDNDSAYVRFKSGVPHTGYYEHFIFYPFGVHLTAQINVKHADGIYTKHFSQRNRPGYWLSLGVFKVIKGDENYIEITATSPGGVVADAVMLRPMNEVSIINSKEEIQRVPSLEYDDSDWQTLKVPGHFGMINKYSNYSGKGWYRKDINLPDTWKRQSDERVRLRFEGVYHVAKVYFNGHYIGRHQGGFTPFEFDVSKEINYSGKNILAVEANNDYWVGATWNWGGIIRDVNLIKTSDVRVKYQYIHAEPNLQNGTADYKIKVRVENDSPRERLVDVQTDIFKDKLLSSSSQKIVVAANSIKELELKGQLSADQVKLWHFDRPELYNFETSVMESGVLLNKKRDRFGIRKFEAINNKMVLNGEPVRLVGFNRVSDHRYWGSSEPEKLLRLDVDMMKTAGANFMRIMHGTQNKKLIELCDEKGILIFEEANIRELTNPEFIAPEYTLAKQWIREMIERDINHPSIVGWSVGNELKEHFDYVKSTYNYAKQLDPYRMVLHVSNQGHKKGESPTNNPLGYGDMIFQNIYSFQGNAGVVMDTLHARWPDKPIFLSEFGVDRFTTPSLDNDIKDLGSWYDHMRGQRPFVNGASIWTFNDYKSGYSETLAEENRAWGVVNAWRTKRRSFYTYQNESSPAKDIIVENIDFKKQSADITIIIRDADDLPSYTMKDYKLRFTFIDIKGNDLYSKQIDVPVLVPGRERWKQQISWSKLNDIPLQMKVELVSTNGYTRREKNVFFNKPSKPIIDEVKASENNIRIYFTKSFDSFEYYAKYEIEGEEAATAKTIANYIDIDSVSTDTNVKLTLIASNDKGESLSSEEITVITRGKALPPIVWDGFISDNKLIVGYSGAWEDEQYTVRYGRSPQNLNNTETSNTRGMMIVPIDGEKKMYFQIMRTTNKGISQWSNIVEALEDRFRIYK